MEIYKNKDKVYTVSFGKQLNCQVYMSMMIDQYIIDNNRYRI